MKIGIDIDDTMTLVRDKLTNAAREYAIFLGKDLTKKYYGNFSSRYQKMFGFSKEELIYFRKNMHVKIANEALPRQWCAEVIKKLHEDGHKIFIITARGYEVYDNPYLESKHWLDKNDIYFDKLIVDAENKGKVCKENNIDILIDDSDKNCVSALEYGIDAIMIGSKEDMAGSIKVFSNWNEIYQYITLKFGK